MCSVESRRIICEVPSIAAPTAFGMVHRANYPVDYVNVSHNHYYYENAIVHLEQFSATFTNRHLANVEHEWKNRVTRILPQPTCSDSGGQFQWRWPTRTSEDARNLETGKRGACRHSGRQLFRWWRQSWNRAPRETIMIRIIHKLRKICSKNVISAWTHI
jgi:hypothetical protein